MRCFVAVCWQLQKEQKKICNNDLQLLNIVEWMVHHPISICTGNLLCVICTIPLCRHGDKSWFYSTLDSLLVLKGVSLPLSWVRLCIWDIINTGWNSDSLVELGCICGFIDTTFITTWALVTQGDSIIDTYSRIRPHQIVNNALYLQLYILYISLMP